MPGKKISSDLEFSLFSQFKNSSTFLVYKFLHILSVKINLFIRQNIKTVQAFLPNQTSMSGLSNHVILELFSSLKSNLTHRCLCLYKANISIAGTVFVVSLQCQLNQLMRKIEMPISDTRWQNQLNFFIGKKLQNAKNKKK